MSCFSCLYCKCFTDKSILSFIFQIWSLDHYLVDSSVFSDFIHIQITIAIVTQHPVLSQLQSRWSRSYLTKGHNYCGQGHTLYLIIKVTCIVIKVMVTFIAVKVTFIVVKVIFNSQCHIYFGQICYHGFSIGRLFLVQFNSTQDYFTGQSRY